MTVTCDSIAPRPSLAGRQQPGLNGRGILPAGQPSPSLCAAAQPGANACRVLGASRAAPGHVPRCGHAGGASVAHGLQPGAPHAAAGGHKPMG